MVDIRLGFKCVSVSCGYREHFKINYKAQCPKMKFSNKDLVTFTEEILNGKLHFLCSGNICKTIDTRHHQISCFVLRKK